MKLAGKTVAVVGGAGFVGSHLVEALLKSGAEPTVVDNFWAGTEDRIPDSVRVYDCDIRDREQLEEIITTVGPDAVVHLAALHYIPFCNQNPEATFDVNVLGTRNLLQACKSVSSVSKFVFASSAAVYGPHDDPITEDIVPDPGDIYGRTKLIGEDLVESAGLQTDIDTSVARLFNIFGPRETNPHLIPEIVEQLDGGSRVVELGNLSPQRDFVYVTDVADAFTTLLTTDREPGPFNVGSGEGRSVADVVETFEAVLGESIEIEQDSNRMRDDDPDHLYADVGRIRSETGWTPSVEFKTGIRRLLESSDVEY